MKKLCCLVFALVSLSWSQAHADLTDFTFTFTSSGNSSFLITGSLAATLNVDGSYTAISGSAIDTGSIINSPALAFNLVAGTGTNYPFTYDNLLFPNTNQLLTTTGGLVFAASNGTEFNIWATGSNPPNSYGAMAFINNQQVPSFNSAAPLYGGLPGTFTLTETASTPTPIPAAAWLLGSGLLCLTGFKRKTRKT